MEEIKGVDVQGIRGNVNQGRLVELQTQLLAVAAEVKKVHVELEKMSSKRLWNWTTKFKKRSLRQQSGWLIQRQMALQSEVTQLQMALQSRVTQLQITQGFTKLRLELALQREEMRLELALHREEMALHREEMRSMLAEMAKMFVEVRLFSQMAIMSYFEPVMTVTSSTKRYRDGLFSAYGLNPSSTTFRCFLTGVELPPKKSKVSHIYQKRWPSTFLSILGIDINAPENLLLLWTLIEDAYNKFYITIIPSGGAFICHVLYPNFRGLKIDSQANMLSDLTWDNLDGKELQFPNDFRPAKRMCAFHASLAISYAVQSRWISEEQAPSVPDEAFGSPNYDKELMMKFLEEAQETSLLLPQKLDYCSTSSLSL